MIGTVESKLPRFIFNVFLFFFLNEKLIWLSQKNNRLIKQLYNYVFLHNYADYKSLSNHLSLKLILMSILTVFVGFFCIGIFMMINFIVKFSRKLAQVAFSKGLKHKLAVALSAMLLKFNQICECLDSLTLEIS